MSLPSIQQQRFTLGKYTVIAQPIPHSAHMLRYTIFLGRKRIGSLASMPSEADCLYLEKPPVVPPLKTFYVTSRPGRPKKGTVKPQQPQAEKAPAPGFSAHDLPGLNIPTRSDER